MGYDSAVDCGDTTARKMLVMSEKGDVQRVRGGMHAEKGSFDAVPEYVCRMTDEIYRLTVADIHENTDRER